MVDAGAGAGSVSAVSTWTSSSEVRRASRLPCPGAALDLVDIHVLLEHSKIVAPVLGAWPDGVRAPPR